MTAQFDFDLSAYRFSPAKSVPIVVDDLPVKLSRRERQVFIIRNCESRYLTHNYHKFAGKFIPHIPRWAMRRHLASQRNAIVLDPFVGSGTTLVEAMLSGQKGFGVDVDPLARLVAKVKTTPLSERKLRPVIKSVIAELQRKRTGSFVPEIPTLNHWFSKSAIEDLSTIYSIIDKFSEERDIADFLTVCFSSIIRRVSNADNQTMKTYVSHTHKKIPEKAKPLFEQVLIDYSDRMFKFVQMLPSGVTARVLQGGDSRSLQALVPGKLSSEVDLVVGSPPYIKSVDYIYNQMAELFWIGHRWSLQTQPLQNEFKKKYIGTDRISAKRGQLPEGTGLSSVDAVIFEVYRNDNKLGHVVANYFADMLTHFRSVRSVLRRGGAYVIVVGDSTLAGVFVPTHSLLIECAKHVGFSTGALFGYEIRNKHMRFPRSGRGGEVSHDWIIELHNS